ncbi:MAG: hypothetical protein UY09_C0012G0021 [Parcubacteria group bacterium GW2011_GWA2_47_8]|nr:MAG: hypothetical protein UY09_C0012G0021 [Parcubacteria group bacterium GW2011_GWA2_47_8]OHB18758.1 MAG: hypothetical protein A2666_02390 [Parcubacteria group bacterium RIFCSPHIGHO2_01_FULL_47_10b]
MANITNRAPVVKIRTNRQVTIPKIIFEELGLNEGDFVEVTILNDAALIKPKKLVDRDLSEALSDLKAGRVIGPFSTAEAAIKALNS